MRKIVQSSTESSALDKAYTDLPYSNSLFYVRLYVYSRSSRGGEARSAGLCESPLASRAPMRIIMTPRGQAYPHI